MNRYFSDESFGRAKLPSLAKEGWLRPSTRCRAASLAGADGVVGSSHRLSVVEQTTPAAPSKEGEHFLDGASTPPWPRRGVLFGRGLAALCSFLCLLWPVPSLHAQTSPRAVLDKYCITCHNERLKVAGLMLDKADAEHIGANAQLWEKVLRKLRAREMPPASPHPDDATYTAMSTHIEKMLDDAAAANPNPGRVAVHRLNRTEYSNSRRDLLGLQIDGKTFLSAN